MILGGEERRSHCFLGVSWAAAGGMVDVGFCLQESALQAAEINGSGFLVIPALPASLKGS